MTSTIDRIAATITAAVAAERAAIEALNAIIDQIPDEDLMTPEEEAAHDAAYAAAWDAWKKTLDAAIDALHLIGIDRDTAKTLIRDPRYRSRLDALCARCAAK